MASSLKAGHTGLILTFSILLCVFITILILSAPSSSFSKIADQNGSRRTSSINPKDRNVGGKIILKNKMTYDNF